MASLLLSVSVLAALEGLEARSGSEMIVDLSHTLSPERMPLVEGGTPLELIVENKDEGFGARSRYLEFCMDELLGTHLAAPSMYLHLNDTPSADAIPVERLVHVPAVVVDLEWTPSNRAPLLTRNALLDFEQRHNTKIPQGGLVLLRTGWDKFFRQADKFVGHFAKEPNQLFPSFSSDAVRWLLNERDVLGLGTECVDVELGWRSKHEIKQMLAIRHRYSLLQLTNLDKLPNVDLRLVVAPLKLSGGAGGPARVFALFHSGLDPVNRLYNDQGDHAQRSVHVKQKQKGNNAIAINNNRSIQLALTALTLLVLS